MQTNSTRLQVRNFLNFLMACWQKPRYRKYCRRYCNANGSLLCRWPSRCCQIQFVGSMLENKHRSEIGTLISPDMVQDITTYACWFLAVPASSVTTCLTRSGFSRGPRAQRPMQIHRIRSIQHPEHSSSSMHPGLGDASRNYHPRIVERPADSA